MHPAKAKACEEGHVPVTAEASLNNHTQFQETGTDLATVLPSQMLLQHLK